MRRLHYVLCVCAFIAVVVATTRTTNAVIIYQNETLTTPNQLYTDNGAYVLMWYGGFNIYDFLIWKDVATGYPIWTSWNDGGWEGGWGTHTDQWGNVGSHAVMQGDGNFVLYDWDYSDAVWATMTSTGSFVNLQNDGNIVVYDSSNSPLWSLY